jgi:rhamnose transport system substrate-binding protein
VTAAAAATPAHAPARAAALRAAMASQQAVLALVVTVEVVLFSITGTNFLSADNGFEIVRGTVEIGLLAVALTPVIVTGGIDLSVGSLMGLSAVALGKLWRDAGWPIEAAVAGTLALGALAGLFNGLMITRLRIPPLIVTLGTYSLFRGLAEGITKVSQNVSRFPDTFTPLGQGYVFGVVPVQSILFAVVAAAFYVLLHRTTIGRGLFAIGFAPDGARHAGIPVARRLTLVYVLSGLVASLAGVLYVAHWDQAKSDAGTGAELLAITAVVLGGTSIFGGRGSILGTLLGWLVIAVLQQGLTLSDWPKELAGVVTGVLLIAAIVLNQLLVRLTGRRKLAATAAAAVAPAGAPPQNSQT